MNFLFDNKYKKIYYVLLILLIIFNYYRTYKKYQLNKPYKEKIKIIQKTVMNSTNELVKDKSNHLFGLKKFNNKNKIDLSKLCRILNLDISNNIIELEGSCTVKQVLDFLIPKGYMLPIIPDMSHLNMGGIVSGVGGGSASFKNGCFHDNIIEYDILLGDGRILTCSEKENTDLFAAIPNTLGTIGYITKLKMKIINNKPYVITENHTFNNFEDFLKFINISKKDETIDFLDGTLYDSSNCICIIGRLTNDKPLKLDNFINDKIYWKAIQTEKKHNFKLIDYIYRWDTDLYYTSINKKIPKFLNNSSIRQLVPKSLIPVIKSCIPYLGIEVNIEDIVSDVLIPIKKANDFFKWYDENINLYPVYICPAFSKNNKFTFWTGDELLDFGIGYGVIPENPTEKTALIENKMIELGGRKLLYSIHQMNDDKFWSIYNKNKYDELRKKYNSKFPNLFEKLKK